MDLQNARGFDHLAAKSDWGREQVEIFSRFEEKKVKQVKADLVEVGFSELQDLEKENDHLKNLIGFVISFNNV